VTINGATHVTVTVAVLLFAVPHAFVTFTQYGVVALGLTFSVLLFPPVGDAVLGDVPMYHWYVNGVDPLAVTLSVVFEPELMPTLAG
jgi:hypothetical protein